MPFKKYDDLPVSNCLKVSDIPVKQETGVKNEGQNGDKHFKNLFETNCKRYILALAFIGLVHRNVLITNFSNFGNAQGTSFFQNLNATWR